MLNYLGRTTISTNQESKYDACCKRLLSDKQILACLLRDCTEEFSQYTIEEIIPYIEAPKISSVPIDNDLTGKYLQNETIGGGANESNFPHEGLINFDIYFEVNIPNSIDNIRLIGNVEAQNDCYLDYSLTQRAVYYLSRLISAQKGVVFSGSDYSKIQKVYSIWICLNPLPAWRNTVTQYYIAENSIVGHACEKKENCQLLALLKSSGACD